MNSSIRHLLSAALLAALVVLAFGSVDESTDEFAFEMPDAPTNGPAAPPSGGVLDATETADGIRRDLPEVLAMLSGDELTDDQKQTWFDREIAGQWFVVEGSVEDIGTTWLGEKYVTIRATPGNFCDVYLDEDFDILSRRVGESATFVGRFVLRGTGSFVHRKFEDGRDLAGAAVPNPSPGRESNTGAIGTIMLGDACRRLRDGGRSIDQRQLIFENEYQGRKVLVEGKVTDVGTFLGEKYITVVAGGQEVDIIPSEDFDLLAFRKGENVSFEGTFTFFDPTLNFHARVESAMRR